MMKDKMLIEIEKLYPKLNEAKYMNDNYLNGINNTIENVKTILRKYEQI